MGKRLDISAAKHAAIFGDPEDLWDDEKGGKKRKCKVCGGWHRLDRPWPHNCREPQRNMQHLPAPMLIPDITPHREGDTVINSRSDQREFMKKNDLVEFETFDESSGTHKQFAEKGTSEYRQYEEDLVEDIKRAIEEDPLNRPPPKMIEQANDEATDAEQISTEGMEVVGDEHSTAT